MPPISQTESFKTLKRRILRSEPMQNAVTWLLARYIRLVRLTCRLEMQVDPLAEAYVSGKEHAIFAFWHGRMMMMPAFKPPHHAMRVLISQHRDGRVIAGVIARFGQKVIHGSSSKGGRAALQEMLLSIRRGDNISITPDGPRGPAKIASPGVIAMARISQRPIIPVTFSATPNYLYRNSWDRFMLALPFSRVLIIAGAPISILPHALEAERESARQLLEQRLNELTIKADAQTGARS